MKNLKLKKQYKKFLEHKKSLKLGLGFHYIIESKKMLDLKDLKKCLLILFIAFQSYNSNANTNKTIFPKNCVMKGNRCFHGNTDFTLYYENIKVAAFVDTFLAYVKPVEGFSKIPYQDGLLLTYGYGTQHNIPKNIDIKKMNEGDYHWLAKSHIMGEINTIYKNKPYFLKLNFNEQIAIMDYVYNVGYKVFMQQDLYHIIDLYYRDKSLLTCGLIRSSFLSALTQKDIQTNKYIFKRGLLKRRINEHNLFIEKTNCDKLNYETELKNIQNKTLKKKKKIVVLKRIRK